MRSRSKSLSFGAFVLAGAFLLTSFRSAEAASASFGPITTTAEVPTALVLNITILDAATGIPLPSMDFGQLSQSGDEFQSDRVFRVLLQVNAQGAPYEIKQQASPLTRSGGAEEIPSGAFSAKPVYSEADNAGLPIPSGSRIASTGPAEGSKTVYSDPSGLSRTISLLYALSGNPELGATEKIPFNQPSGAYSGTIQFTLTTS